MNETWVRRYFSLAMEVGGWSKDPNTQVGALIISPNRRQFVAGYNGFPARVKDDPSRLANKSLKNKLMVHAELNAIINSSTLLHNWTMIVTKAPCSDCAKAIINAGIARVICPSPEGSWRESQLFAISILKEAHVEVEFL